MKPSDRLKDFNPLTLAQAIVNRLNRDTQVQAFGMIIDALLKLEKLGSLVLQEALTRSGFEVKTVDYPAGKSFTYVWEKSWREVGVTRGLPEVYAVEGAILQFLKEIAQESKRNKTKTVEMGNRAFFSFCTMHGVVRLSMEVYTNFPKRDEKGRKI